MKARASARSRRTTHRETNSRHEATSHQLVGETQAERKSLGASADDEKSHHSRACARRPLNILPVRRPVPAV